MLLETEIFKKIVCEQENWTKIELLNRIETLETKDILTLRQFQVLKCMVFGMGPREIGRRLGIRVGTVGCHINAVHKKLKISNRVQLIEKLKRLKLIDLSYLDVHDK